MRRRAIDEHVAPRRFSELALYRRVLLQARPQWPHILGLFLLSLLSTPLALLTPLPLKIVVDSVIGTRPLSPLVGRALPETITSSPTALLIFSACLLVSIAVLSRLQELASNLLRTYTGEKLLLEFRTRLFRHVQRLSLTYHDMRGSSDSTYRIQYDAAAIQGVAMDGVMPVIVAGVTLLSMIYVTLRIDRQLALVALAICPFLYLLTRSSLRQLRRQSREVKQLESSAMSVVQEVLGAVRVVKAFGQEEREHGRFVRRYRESMWARIRLALSEGRFGLLIGVNIALGTAAVLLIGTQHVRSGAISLGELLLVMGYLAQLYQPMKTMSKKVGSIQSGLASAERTFALLDEAPDAPEKPDARPLGRATGAIEFRHLGFAYEKDRFVLEDLCFNVSPGMRVGIAGATGVGKTTLVSLLLRFYDPTKGQILLDGVDLRDYKLPDLRNQFAIVLQEPVLFSASIAENIAYACPEAGWEEIHEAAKAAGAHDFIHRLPEGYQTLVGDRGMRLSGGERQRISLARAFLKNAPILILDEPTSSVDVRTEADILQALERLMRGRTTFVIAHRDSTLRGCDVVLHMERGRFVDTQWAEEGVAGAKQSSLQDGILNSGRADGNMDWALTGKGARTTAPAVAVREPQLQKLPVTGIRMSRPGDEKDTTSSLMAETLERGLTRLRGRPTHVLALTREFFEESTSFSTERLCARLEDGSSLKVFLKDLNPRNQTEAAQLLRGTDPRPARRELQVYEQILSRVRIGTPQLYATRWEPERGIHWLFLEDAGGLRLNQTADFDLWVAAARWAARFHAEVRLVPEQCTGFLPSLGVAQYVRCADDIRGKLQQFDEEERAVIREALEFYRHALRRLQALPQSVIHGEYYAQNIVLREGDPKQPLAVIDWESASIGPRFLDLASLTAGRWSMSQKEAMWRAYFDEYQAATGTVLKWSGFCEALRDLTIYLAFVWLSWWSGSNSSDQFGRWMNNLKRTLHECVQSH